MDSTKISEIADIMRSHGLTRVRVEDPDGSAVELECGGAAPVAAPAAPAPVSAPAPVPAPTPTPRAAMCMYLQRRRKRRP